ncbi:MAG: FtsX-like permease family protein [Sedimentisphaerales bacterium]|nr:FtsX-like permease family protein [Sedimentisphaerales bacterium]
MNAADTEKRTRYDRAGREPVGIRGWLIIPAVIFAGSPIGIMYIIYNLWSLQKMTGLDARIFAAGEIIFAVAVLLYILVFVLSFFKRQRNARQTNIYFVAAGLVAPIPVLFLLTLGLITWLKIVLPEKITVSNEMIYAIHGIVLQIAVLFYTFIAALRFFSKSRHTSRTCIRFAVICLVALLLKLIFRHVFIGDVYPILLALITFVIFCVIAATIFFLNFFYAALLLQFSFEKIFFGNGYSLVFIVASVCLVCGIAAATWILYFKKSRRVQATFINTEDGFGLPYKFALPIRYFTQRRISWLAFSAVALCVFIIVVVMTIMSGLVNDFKERNHRFVGDCVIGTDSLVGFAYYEDFNEILQRQEYVEAVSPVIKNFALKRIKDTKDDDVVEIVGIDPVKHSQATGFGKTLNYRRDNIPKAFKPKYDPNLTGCVLGEYLLRRDMRKLGLYSSRTEPPEIGYHISSFPLTAKGALAQAGTDMVNTKTFYCSDKSSSGLPREDDSLVYLPFEQAQLLCGMDGPPKRVSLLSIKFKPDEKLRDGCKKIQSLWQQYRLEQADQTQAYLLDTVKVQSWKSYRRESIAPMENEQTELIVMFGFVAITTVFIIWVVFYMIISHKSKDIGILKSLGASSADVYGLFLGFAFLIALFGSCIGSYIGWLFLLCINRMEEWLFVYFGFQLWDRSIFVGIGAIPNKVEPDVLAIIAVSAIVICLIGAFVPSRQAARRRPAETLQVNQL